MSILVAVPKTRSLATGTEGRARLEAYAEVSEFSIPALNIGTYDSLVQLSDSLDRVQSTVESVTARLHKQLLDSRAKQGISEPEPIMIQGGHATYRLEGFCANFRWADDKYPTGLPLREISEEIQTKVTKFADTLQGKVQAYTKLVGELSGASNRASGNMLNCDLVPPIVSELDFIEQRGCPDYCSSVFCVIQKAEARSFEMTVGGISSYITYPKDGRGQIKCLRADETFCLYVLWVVNDTQLGPGIARTDGSPPTPKSDLLKALREKRWQFRTDVEWDPEAAQAAQTRMNELMSERKVEDKKLMTWITTIFSEAYINYVHLKAVSVFVESVLRYGLGTDGTPEYIAYCVEPRRSKDHTATRAILEALYSDGTKDDEAADMMGGRREYFPYVSETISNFGD